MDNMYCIINYPNSKSAVYINRIDCDKVKLTTKPVIPICRYDVLDPDARAEIIQVADVLNDFEGIPCQMGISEFTRVILTSLRNEALRNEFSRVYALYPAKVQPGSAYSLDAVSHNRAVLAILECQAKNAETPDNIMHIVANLLREFCLESQYTRSLFCISSEIARPMVSPTVADLSQFIDVDFKREVQNVWLAK